VVEVRRSRASRTCWAAARRRLADDQSGGAATSRGSLDILIFWRSAPAGGVQNCRKILKSKLKNNLKTEVNDRLPFRNGSIGRLSGGPGTRAEKSDEAVRRRPRS